MKVVWRFGTRQAANRRWESDPWPRPPDSTAAASSTSAPQCSSAARLPQASAWGVRHRAATRVESRTNPRRTGPFVRYPSFLGSEWYRFPMEAIIDNAGRVVVPKPIRDALGLLPGTKVDISPYGAGAQLVPAGRTARLVDEGGQLVAAGETPVDDDIVFALIDAGRK